MDIEENLSKLRAKLSDLNKKIHKGKLLLVGIAAIGTGYFLTDIASELNPKSTATKVDISQQSLGNFPITIPTLKYGFALDTFDVHNDTIQNNQFLADILLKHHVPYINIDQIARETKDIYDVRSLRADRPFTILSKDSSQMADYFVYEPDVYRYVIYDLKNPLNTKVVEKEITRKMRSASGVIESSLWNTMVDNGLSFELTSKMEDALAWSIDFYHVQKGDKFKAIFEELYIDGKAVGVGKVEAAYYKNADNEYYAIHYANEKYKGFYDLEARPMKKTFLKSPVKYSRISSRYNLRRFHPIQKRVKPHYGTDYAAPTGTPIYAVSNGTVTKASYTKGNGKYVKIKHDKTYQTQYLHMNGFAKGIRAGSSVKQGDVIGYVGSTGLATGPHVCFRFWKNGRQVNHLKMNFPPLDPMPKDQIPQFNVIRGSIIVQLGAVHFAEKEVVVEEITPAETKDASETSSTSTAEPDKAEEAEKIITVKKTLGNP